MAETSYADRGRGLPSSASCVLGQVVGFGLYHWLVSGRAGIPAGAVFSMMRTMDRDRSGPTDVARISRFDRRLPSRSSYSLV